MCDCCYSQICLDHACPCALSGKDFEEKVYQSLKQTYDREVMDLEDQEEYESKREIERMSGIFSEPVLVGKCPNCGEHTYSENDPSNDTAMNEMCCGCDWHRNQYLDYEDMQ